MMDVRKKKGVAEQDLIPRSLQKFGTWQVDGRAKTVAGQYSMSQLCAFDVATLKRLLAEHITELQAQKSTVVEDMRSRQHQAQGDAPKRTTSTREDGGMFCMVGA